MTLLEFFLDLTFYLSNKRHRFVRAKFYKSKLDLEFLLQLKCKMLNHRLIVNVLV